MNVFKVQSLQNLDPQSESFSESRPKTCTSYLIFIKFQIPYLLRKKCQTPLTLPRKYSNFLKASDRVFPFKDGQGLRLRAGSRQYCGDVC